MSTRDASRVTRNQSLHGNDMIIQIMHINQRIRIKTSENESLSNFFQKVGLHYLILCLIFHFIVNPLFRDRLAQQSTRPA